MNRSLYLHAEISGAATTRRSKVTRLSAFALVAVAVAALAPAAQAQAHPISSAPGAVATAPVSPAGLRAVISDPVCPGIAKAQALATPVPQDPIQITISLKPRDPAGLQAFADSVSDPASTNYRKFLTPAELGVRFGATAADQAAVVSYLQSQGLKVTAVGASRMSIFAQGTPTQIAAAFGTTIRQYQGVAQDGKTLQTFRANATPLTVPTAIANTIVCVSGIDTYMRPMKRATTTTLYPALVHGLYSTAPTYNIGYQGQGRTIAISNFDGYRLSNAQTFISQWGLPVPAAGALSNVTVVPVETPAGTGTPSGEGDLDIQMVLSTAPLANILIYDNSNDYVGTITKEQEDNLADVLTESYGWNLTGHQDAAVALHNEHLLMTAQGQTYMVASGDTGTSFQGYDYPDFEPEVLLVGGTQATVDSTTGARVSEVGWNDNNGQGGGGWSTYSISYNVLPSWQKGRGVPTNINFRLGPDVALHAGAGNGAGAYYTVWKGAWYAFDGTSASSPVFASSLAIVEQRLFHASPSVTPRLGRINDLIYAQNGRSDLWFDVTSGTNGTLPNGTVSNAGTGWDFVSGWGALNFDAFYHSFFGGRP